MKRLASLLVVILTAAAPAVVRAEPVTCKDGATSKAGPGACSHHGGVADADQAPATVTAKRTPKAKASVKCADGTTGTAGRGACSHHGGMDTADRTRPQHTRERADATTHAPTTTTTTTTTRAPQPEPSQTPTTASHPTAVCKDGTVSTSAHHSGTCSHHGGVKTWTDQNGG
jgi:hypothetical protein